MIIKAVLKDSIFYFFSNALARGVPILLTPILTRYLTKDEFGHFDLFIIFTSIINLTISLEITQGVARYYSTESNIQMKKIYASTALWFTLGCYSFFSIFALFFLKYCQISLPEFNSSNLAFLFGIIYIWTFGLYYVIQNQLRWSLAAKRYAVVSIISSCTLLISTLLFLFFSDFGLSGVIFSMILGNISGLTVGICFSYSTFKLDFNVGALKKMLSYSAPLVL